MLVLTHSSLWCLACSRWCYLIIVYLMFTTSMLDFIFLYYSMFSSDVPITTAPMIWSVAWDVMRGGSLGTTMVLWRHWRLGGTAYLASLFLIAMLLSVNVMFLFCSFPSLFDRWLDSSFLSFRYSVFVREFSPRNVDPVLPGVDIFLSVWPFSSFL